MRYLLIFSIVFFSVTVFAQNKKGEKYFNKGVKAYKENDFKTAASMFEISLSFEKNKDIYNNLALTRYILGDSCGFCENIRKSVEYGNAEGNKVYEAKCIKYDTVFYENIKEKDITYYKVKQFEKCLKKTAVRFFKENSDHVIIETFEIIPSKDLQLSDSILSNPMFEIEKVPSANISRILPDSEIVFINVDKKPEFPGGCDSLNVFIKKNTNKKLLVQVSNKERYRFVYLRFIVERDGSISNTSILMKYNEEYDSEAINLVKKMPNWNAGMRNGKKVKVEITMPIIFSYPYKQCNVLPFEIKNTSTK
jgi:tetratricopeptide (TPR) repeat protein